MLLPCAVRMPLLLQMGSMAMGLLPQPHPVTMSLQVGTMNVCRVVLRLSVRGAGRGSGSRRCEAPE